MDIDFSFSDFEIAKKILEKHGSMTAREMSSFALEFGVKWDKGKSNSVLYKMLAKNLVQKDTNRGSRPFWTVASDSNPNPKQQETLKLRRKSADINDFVPLKAIVEYTINLKDSTIEFALNTEASPNDPYITCDWLEKKIFVAINPNHPYIRNGIVNEKVLSEFLLFLALDAHCEWHVVRSSKGNNSNSFIALKDSLLRSIH